MTLIKRDEGFIISRKVLAQRLDLLFEQDSHAVQLFSPFHMAWYPGLADGFFRGHPDPLLLTGAAGLAGHR